MRCEAYLDAVAGNSVARAYLPDEFVLVDVQLIDPYTAESSTWSGEQFASHVDFMLSRTTAIERLEAWKKLVALEAR